MAIAATASTAAAGNQTSATTLVLTVAGANISVGQLVVVFIAADNAGASGVSSISSVTDSGGNTYVLGRLTNRTAGSVANDACTCAIYGSFITTALTSGTSTITVNFSPATTAKAAIYRTFSGVGSLAPSSQNISNTGSGATYDTTAVTGVPYGCLVTACCANESATVPGNDSDTLGGTWTQSSQSSGGSGGDATKMALLAAYKIPNAPDTAQRFDGATGASTDWTAEIVVYYEPAISMVGAGATRARVAWVNP